MSVNVTVRIGRSGQFHHASHAKATVASGKRKRATRRSRFIHELFSASSHPSAYIYSTVSLGMPTPGFTPKGLHNEAQGSPRQRATLGIEPHSFRSTPKGLHRLRV